MIKHSKQRDAILTYLHSTKSHPTAETVYENVRESIPNISLGTVYRNLSLFKDQGLIASLGTVGGVERFDADTEPHVHFICNHCDSVLDLPELDPPESLRSAAANATGGEVSGCQLIFTGICKDCLNSLEESL